jgi:hypothetical protein
MGDHNSYSDKFKAQGQKRGKTLNLELESLKILSLSLLQTLFDAHRGQLRLVTP